MSKAREAFYSLSDEEYYSMQGMDTAAEYIKELKEENATLIKYIEDYKENMLEYCKEIEENQKKLLKLIEYCCFNEDFDADSVISATEKIIGKSIEEVFKDE
jgi:hypothetical protein